MWKRHIRNVLSGLFILVFAFALTGCKTVNVEGTDTQTDTWKDGLSKEEERLSEDGRKLITLSKFLVDENDEIVKAVAAFNQVNTEYYVEIQSAETGVSATDYWDREMIEIMEARPEYMVFQEGYEPSYLSHEYYDEASGARITFTAKHTLPRASCITGCVGKIDSVSEGQIQTVRELIERSGNSCFDWDITAHNIITEEAESYFSDQRSLEDVMANIQNRMDLYMAEKE